MDKIIITSLQEYIKYISESTHNDFYFRGESNYFHDRISSGLRNIECFDFGQAEKHRVPFFNYIKEYYMEVGNRLNEIDRKNFICFSQHHGIPTNLLDISRDPLVALYFACQDVNKSTSGYIYMFKKDNVLDITQYLPEYNMYDNSEFILELCRLEKEKLINTIQLFKSFFKQRKKLFEKLFLSLIEDRKHLFKGLQDYDENILNMFEDFLNDEEKDTESIINIIESLQKTLNTDIFKIVFEEEEDYFITIYVLLFIDYFKSIVEFGEPVFRINFLPNFKYEPISSFQRIKHQKGLFFYQSYLNYKEPVYEVDGYSIQRISYDIELEIRNKGEILKSLDKIGINRKTIFDDFDNIAKYIVESLKDK